MSSETVVTHRTMLDTTQIDLPSARAQTKWYGPLAAVLWTGFALIEHPGGRALLLLGAIAASGIFIFHGLTVLISLTPVRWRTAAQVVVSAATPLILTLYFLRNGEMTIESAESFFKWPTFIVFAIIGYISMAFGTALDRHLWFRGFLIAATVLFVSCWMGMNGVRLSSSDDEYPDFEPEMIAYSNPASHFLTQYAIYVGISFSGLAIGYRKAQRKLPP